MTTDIPVTQAGELMQEFYLSPAYDPKAKRPADTVEAAIAFTLDRLASSAPQAGERPWCETCGKDVPEVLCPTCAKWWADNPLPAAGKVGELVERLRRKVQVTPAFGGGTISSSGEASSYITDDGRRYANPDGPEAADTIGSLQADLAAAQDREAKLMEALEPFARVAQDDDGALFADDTAIGERGAGCVITFAHLRRARLALAADAPNPGDGE